MSSNNSDYDLPGYNPRAREARARRIPIWRWVLWHMALVTGMLVFYVGLTPVWIGLRGAAWVAEFRARRRRPKQGTDPPPPASADA
jgi:hypothetical protein